MKKRFNDTMWYIGLGASALAIYLACWVFVNPTVTAIRTITIDPAVFVTALGVN